MNKFVIAGFAAAAAMTVTAEITSANVVGYQTYADEMGVNNITAALTPINATGSWTFDTKVFDTEAQAGDTIMVLNMDIFDLDFYQFLGFDGEAKSLGWAYNTADLMTGDPIQEELTSFEVKPGEVTYTQPGDDMSGFTVAGQVADVNGVTVTIPDSMPVDFTNPYPMATTLGDLESFCKIGDTLMVLNFEIFDLDFYQYLGKEEGWVYNTTDMMTGDPISDIIKDSTKVVLPAGQGGYFQASDDDGRTWNVAL